MHPCSESKGTAIGTHFSHFVFFTIFSRLTEIEPTADGCHDNLNSVEATHKAKDRALMLVDGVDSDNMNR